MTDETYDKVRRAKKIYRDRLHDVQQDKLDSLRRRRQLTKGGSFATADDLDHTNTVH